MATQLSIKVVAQQLAHPTVPLVITRDEIFGLRDGALVWQRLLEDPKHAWWPSMELAEPRSCCWRSLALLTALRVESLAEHCCDAVSRTRLYVLRARAMQQASNFELPKLVGVAAMDSEKLFAAYHLRTALACWPCWRLVQLASQLEGVGQAAKVYDVIVALSEENVSAAELAAARRQTECASRNIKKGLSASQQRLAACIVSELASQKTERDAGTMAIECVEALAAAVNHWSVDRPDDLASFSERVIRMRLGSYCQTL
jgi:hypothetical protein